MEEAKNDAAAKKKASLQLPVLSYKNPEMENEKKKKYQAKNIFDGMTKTVEDTYNGVFRVLSISSADIERR